MTTTDKMWLWTGGFALTALGGAVMYGWAIKSAALTQIHPDFVAMQFNTALGFGLLGLAAMTAPLRTPWPSNGLAAAVLVIGALTGVQYLTGADLGIDQLLMDHYTVTKTSHPGRMAPNTALCFALAGLALLSLRGNREFTAAGAYRCGALGLAVFGLGFIAAVGYAAGAETTYGWGRLTRMALHTSLGFIASGALLCVPAWTRRDTLGSVRLVPSAAAVGFALLSIALWTVIEATDNRKLKAWGRAEISGAISNIATALERDRRALERMGARFDNRIVETEDEWQFDARSYLDDMLALEYLKLEAEPDIRWEWPHHNEKRLQGDNPPAGKFLVAIPLERERPGVLTAKFDGRLFVEDTLDDSVPVAAYRVEFNDQLIAERTLGRPPIMEIRIREDRLIDLTPLSVEIVLDYARLRRLSSAASTAALVVGLILAALTWLLLRLYYRERERTEYKAALLRNLERKNPRPNA